MVEDKNCIIGSDVVEVYIKTLPNTETFPLPQCTYLIHHLVNVEYSRH